MSKSYELPQVDEVTWRRRFKEGWLLPLQIARRWGVAESTVFRWLKQGKLIAIQDVVHRRVLVEPHQGRP